MKYNGYLCKDYASATAIFLYLVPRGLKLMLPILEKVPRKLRVVTYMCPFPDSAIVRNIVKVKTSKHADAQWPLFVYEINSHLPWETSCESLSVAFDMHFRAFLHAYHCGNWSWLFSIQKKRTSTYVSLTENFIIFHNFFIDWTKC